MKCIRVVHHLGVGLFYLILPTVLLLLCICSVTVRDSHMYRLQFTVINYGLCKPV